MAVWTKLIAVNRMLRAGGENPVNTLASVSGDSLIAEAILDEVNAEYQLRGIAANSENVTLIADGGGKIAIGNEVLHVEQIQDETGTSNKFDKWIVQRGGFLYNVTDNTDTFDVGEEIRVKKVIGLNYEELPFADQVAIADESARRYQMVVQGDPSVDAMLREIWAQSRARARANNIRVRRPNIFGRWGSRLPYGAAKLTTRPWWR